MGVRGDLLLRKEPKKTSIDTDCHNIVRRKGEHNGFAVEGKKEKDDTNEIKYEMTIEWRMSIKWSNGILNNSSYLK